jgi:hypothetical protein
MVSFCHILCRILKCPPNYRYWVTQT